MKCSICFGSFKPMGVKKETESGFFRLICFYKCSLCGCGRIDYHPKFPNEDNTDEES